MKRLPAQTVIYLPELLRFVNDETDYENKKTLITQYVNKDSMHFGVVQAFMELMWSPYIKWLLPEGSPPYTPISTNVGESPSSLFKIFKQVNRFLENGSGLLQDPTRRELYFVTLLESLSKDEGKLLCQIKEKHLTSYPNITLEVFAELFPEILPEDVVKKQAELVKKPISTKQVIGLENLKLIPETPVKKSAGRPKKSTI